MIQLIPMWPSNLEALLPSTTANKADCDKENATHNPNQQAGFFGRICDPVPPFSIAMNGRLLIVVGNPPLAVFISRIWFAPSAQLEEEGVYWNVLFDTNQDGAWSSSPAHSEWVAQDEFVPFAPPALGPIVVTPAFQWGSSGNPFGRLIFPVWARNMVTSESVANTVGLGPNDYDGRGPGGGFSKGEIEDYFVEWRPIGQMLPSGDSAKTKYAASEGLVELLPSFHGPEEATIGGQIILESAGPKLHGISLICMPKKSGIAAGAADIQSDGKEVSVCAEKQMSVSASWTNGKVNINIESAPVGALLLLLGSTGGESQLGSGNIPIHGGKVITLRTP